MLHRRSLLAGLGMAAASPALATPALAQNPHAHHAGQFERLNQPGRIKRRRAAFPACRDRKPGPESPPAGAMEAAGAPAPAPHGNGLGR